MTDAHDDERLARLLRLVVREELERAEARRKGQRTSGERRVRSPELRAQLAAQIAGPVDEVTAARVRRTLARRRAG